MDDLRMNISNKSCYYIKSCNNLTPISCIIPIALKNNMITYKTIKYRLKCPNVNYSNIMIVNNSFSMFSKIICGI